MSLLLAYVDLTKILVPQFIPAMHVLLNLLNLL